MLRVLGPRITADTSQHADLRATYTLLYRYTLGRQQLADAETRCSELEAQLQKERQESDILKAALERQNAAERELLAVQRNLEEENTRLRAERNDWRTSDRKYDQCSAEYQQLSEELQAIKDTHTVRSLETRQFYLHDISGAKAEPVAILKDSPDSEDALKVTIAGRDNIYQLSPVRSDQPIPDLPSTLLTFQPLTDDIDEAAHDGTNYRSHISSSRAISIQPKPDAPRFRSHSSMLSAADPDAMAISLPRSTLDVHMASVSSSPLVSSVQYSLRPAEFVSSSLGRVPENALGLRTVEPVRMSPSTTTQEALQRQWVAQLNDVLTDHITPSSTSLSRKPTLSDAGSDRSAPNVPGGISSTRTPSPVSTTSMSHSASSVEKEYSALTQRPQYLSAKPVSSASKAAMEHQQRTRASSTASATAAPPVSPYPPVSSTRDRDAAPPVHAIYAPAPPQAPSPSRPPQPRRQMTEPVSISKGKASAMGLAPPGTYQSGLTRSMRAMQEAPRVS
ncbi:hypothetical protein BN946_scf184806.g17 [Trametes cinnabarina]|uniref:Uncharacterized protein n=1 Tax=Pycnoporus cinnabarinus TaxID=5643 RepID=A0A060S6U4_PYCCI|nr:hypothetical protein BN946_scf184806.g17 [Trametes cinnabarina]